MKALSYRRRKLLASSGAMFVCAGFAMMPLIGRPSIVDERRDNPGVTDTIAERGMTFREIHPHTDPFARVFPFGSGAGINRTARPVKPRSAARVAAIVMGNTPHALLETESGATQIVEIGDRVDGTRIAGIVADALILADGRRLKFSEKRI